MTVARAAPATPVWNSRMNPASRAMFSTEDRARKYTVRLSPRGRATPASRLYRKVAGIPRKMIKI